MRRDWAGAHTALARVRSARNAAERDLSCLASCAPTSRMEVRDEELRMRMMVAGGWGAGSTPTERACWRSCRRGALGALAVVAVSSCGEPLWDFYYVNGPAWAATVAQPTSTTTTTSGTTGGAGGATSTSSTGGTGATSSSGSGGTDGGATCQRGRREHDVRAPAAGSACTLGIAPERRMVNSPRLPTAMCKRSRPTRRATSWSPVQFTGSIDFGLGELSASGVHRRLCREARSERVRLSGIWTSVEIRVSSPASPRTAGET